ncbi:hypothetical protein DFR55_14218 [Herbinix hemicellulosilytica]|uniref:DUF4352 domain-containing protein n=1 Tax=Herbinix hemicellulosilytica TaxID=1564487 RepID=A0A0H5SJ14_HERHM|nr:DUF4352 domain-containing protein [Herbinix hemicellulosilytica]RBP56742.1 hypothetical protein DFR55_14218 [Herbinix hemicellulosilytica]CRZ34806.1 hypothetical protein HHT355_1605 [Herbinix hemicellulosilytica]
MKKISFVLICIFALLLTGCMKKYPLNENNINAVAEYMAGLLLKYDKNYSADLLSYSKINETSASEEKEDINDIAENDSKDSNTDTVNEDNNRNESETKEYTLSEVIGETNFDFQYVGYRTVDTLSDDETNQVFYIDAKQGYRFFVVEFEVENITDSEKLLDLIKSDARYMLHINDETTYRPQSVLLENNLLFINTNIKAGEKISAILAFEVEEDADLSNVNLVVTNDTMTKELKVK